MKRRHLLFKIEKWVLWIQPVKPIDRELELEAALDALPVLETAPPALEAAPPALRAALLAQWAIVPLALQEVVHPTLPGNWYC